MSRFRPQDDLWRFFFGALTTRALALAADLGLADALAERARHVDELAADVGADPGTSHTARSGSTC